MKKRIIHLTILSLSFIGLALNAQDTLRNLSAVATRTVNKYTAASSWGYYTGSNYLLREEFAEKYYIQGTRTLVGVISEHSGIVTNPNNATQFRAYTVGSNRLPGTLKASKNVPYGQIDLTGTPMVTIFPASAQVTDSFFVSFNLTDYAHGGFDGDTIALLYGVDGSRAANDLGKFGRNAIRRHSHSGPDWKDFYSQNFTPLATHFALFPILAPLTTGINELETEEFKIASVYPNPFVETIYLKVEKIDVSYLTINIYNDLGQIVKSLNTESLEFTANQEIKIDCKELAAGKYIVFIKGKNTGLATQIIKK
jgi:hypothetical protein